MVRPLAGAARMPTSVSTSSSASSSRRFNGLQQTVDHVAGADALGLRAVADKDSMPQHWMDQCPNVVHGGMVVPLQERPRFSAENGILASSCARAPAHPIVHEPRRGGLAGTAGRGESHGIANDIL